MPSRRSRPRGGINSDHRHHVRVDPRFDDGRVRQGAWHADLSHRGSPRLGGVYICHNISKFAMLPEYIFVFAARTEMNVMNLFVDTCIVSRQTLSKSSVFATKTDPGRMVLIRTLQT